MVKSPVQPADRVRVVAVTLEQVLAAIAELQRDPTQPGALDRVADWLGRSRFHAQRVFTEVAGESPSKLVDRLRLERAAAALMSTDRAITEIAMDAGFASHEGFTRAFRRRFGASPTNYRARSRDTGLTPKHRHKHAEYVKHLAPCVGVYRKPLQPRVKSFMSYDIQRITVEATPILFKRAKIAPDAIAEALGQILPAIFTYATGAGISFAGPPLCRYTSFSPGHIELEAGIPVAPGARGEGDIVLGELPAGPAATTVHVGPYDNLQHAHAAIEAWLEANNETSAGGPWESYVTDPGEVPNPAEWRTQVVHPLVG